MEFARRVREICARYEFAYYGNWGLILAGWCTGGTAGADQIRDGLRRLRDQGALARQPYYLSLLAETLLSAGQRDAAGAVLESARAAAAVHDERWWLPELYRLDARRHRGAAAERPAAPRDQPRRAAGRRGAGPPGRRGPGPATARGRNGRRTLRERLAAYRPGRCRADQAAGRGFGSNHDHHSTAGRVRRAQATAMRGPVIQPGDDGYDAARAVYNAMIDRRPAAIARCADVADVITAVRFAGENGLTVSVRGGGHNAGGLGVWDDALVIDLSAMRGIRVDPGGQDRARPGRLRLGRRRSRHRRIRPGHPVRDPGHHRGRRAHARRRDRPPDPALRAHRRQPAVRRRRARRRLVRHRQRRRAPGPVLGAARRRRELRRGDVVRVPLPRRRHGRRRAGVLRHRRHHRGPALVPRDAAQPARGTQRLVRAAHGPAGPAVPGSSSGCARCAGSSGATPARPSGPTRCSRRSAGSARRCSTRSSRCPTPSCRACSTRCTRPGCSGTGGPTSSTRSRIRPSPSTRKFGEALPTPFSTMHLYPIDGAVHRVGAESTAFAYRDAGWNGVIVGVDPDPANAGKIKDWAVRVLGGAAPHLRRGRVRELHDGRGDRPGAGVLRPQLRPARPHQGHLRPGELLPDQPEHPASQLTAATDAPGRRGPARGTLSG